MRQKALRVFTKPRVATTRAELEGRFRTVTRRDGGAAFIVGRHEKTRQGSTLTGCLGAPLVAPKRYAYPTAWAETWIGVAVLAVWLGV